MSISARGAMKRSEGGGAPAVAREPQVRSVPGRIGRGIRRFWVQIASLVLFLTVWQIVGATTDPVLFATPVRVVKAFAELIGNGQLPAAMKIGAEDVVAGYLLAVVVGVPHGPAVGRRLDG